MTRRKSDQTEHIWFRTQGLNQAQEDERTAEDKKHPYDKAIQLLPRDAASVHERSSASPPGEQGNGQASNEKQ